MKSFKELLTEATKQTKKGVIAKAARKGSPPYTVVVLDRLNKVVKQETTQVADAVPAFVHELQKRYPKGDYKISVEDKGGSRVYSEEVEMEEGTSASDRGEPQTPHTKKQYDALSPKDKKLVDARVKKARYAQPEGRPRMKGHFKSKFKKEEEGIDEGTWELPDTPIQKKTLEKLMSKPLPVGSDLAKKYKNSAEAKLYSIIGDDELFDDLDDLRQKKGEKADARPVVKKAIKRLGIKEENVNEGKRLNRLMKDLGIQIDKPGPNNPTDDEIEAMDSFMASKAIKGWTKNPDGSQGYPFGHPFQSPKRKVKKLMDRFFKNHGMTGPGMIKIIKTDATPKEKAELKQLATQLGNGTPREKELLGKISTIMKESVNEAIWTKRIGADEMRAMASGERPWTIVGMKGKKVIGKSKPISTVSKIPDMLKAFAKGKSEDTGIVVKDADGDVVYTYHRGSMKEGIDEGGMGRMKDPYTIRYVDPKQKDTTNISVVDGEREAKKFLAKVKKKGMSGTIKKGSEQPGSIQTVKYNQSTDQLNKASRYDTLTGKRR